MPAVLSRTKPSGALKRAEINLNGSRTTAYLCELAGQAREDETYRVSARR